MIIIELEGIAASEAKPGKSFLKTLYEKWKKMFISGYCVTKRLMIGFRYWRDMEPVTT